MSNSGRRLVTLYVSRIAHPTDRTAVKYMTDEMLLRELLYKPGLASCSVVMVDEAS